VKRALEEQASTGSHEPVPYLVELHDRGSRLTFAAAVALIAQGGARRQLGLRILKELGGAERPFANETLDLLLPQIERAESAADFRHLVSAIGMQNSPRLLCALAGHEDVLVRYLVA
jgi:hypothetical protein